MIQSLVDESAFTGGVGNSIYINYQTTEDSIAELSHRLSRTFTYSNTVGMVSGWDSTSSGGM